MAALAVALFVLVAYTVIVSGDPGPTAGDLTALDVVEDIRAGWLTDVAKVVTALGSAAVVLPLAAICAALLALRRRWPEFGCCRRHGDHPSAAHELKDAVDRPRPAGGLVDSLRLLLSQRARRPRRSSTSGSR